VSWFACDSPCSGELIQQQRTAAVQQQSELKPFDSEAPQRICGSDAVRFYS